MLKQELHTLVDEQTDATVLANLLTHAYNPPLSPFTYTAEGAEPSEARALGTPAEPDYLPQWMEDRLAHSFADLAAGRVMTLEEFTKRGADERAARALKFK